MAAGEQRARFTHLLLRGVEDGANRLGRKLLREGCDGQCDQRQAAHREDVVQRVRRRDRAEVAGIVDDRREEVDREHERALVVEPVHRCVVRRVEADEQALRLRGHEAAQQLLESRGGVLRGATAGRREVRQLDGGVHSPSVTGGGLVQTDAARGRGTSCAASIRRARRRSSP